MARARRLLAAALLAAAPGCSAGAAAPPPAVPQGVVLPPLGPRPEFTYETLDGKELSPAALAGRLSVIGLVSTYDVASQAQARFLAALAREHTPRLNVALIVLEPPENRPLVEAFASAMKLPFPIALADAPTIAGRGPFGGLHTVPSVVILNREGREAYRKIGVQPQEELEEVLRAIERPRRARPRAPAPATE